MSIAAILEIQDNMKSSFDVLKEGLKRAALEIVDAIFAHELEKLRQVVEPRDVVLSREVVRPKTATRKVETPVAPAPELPKAEVVKKDLMDKRKVGDIWKRMDSKYEYIIFSVLGDMTGMQKVGTKLQIHVSPASLRSKWRPVDAAQQG